MSNKRNRAHLWLLAGAAVAGAGAGSAAYRFAVGYRERAGSPQRSPIASTPEEFGLAYERVEIPSPAGLLAGWFVPASEDGAGLGQKRRSRAVATPPAEPRPGIVIVHGWESNRGRTLAHARYLHAAGFHCLVFDVRGHGDSPSEELPINVPEFAEDATAAARWMAARPNVSAVGLLGHSMGGAGVVVAASKEPLVGAVVSISAPAELVSMTRHSFTMAEMDLPEVIATPLAWVTARVLLAPRGHSLSDASAVAAAHRYHGPLLLAHGAQDHGVPVAHLELIGRAADESRGPADPPVETLVLREFGHRWLYESPEFRRRVAAFFAEALGGPVSPEIAASRAEACAVVRPADPVYGFGALPAKPQSR